MCNEPNDSTNETLKMGSGSSPFDETVVSGDSGSSDVIAPPSMSDIEILGELGRGGMGVVFRARQTYLDRPVALKVLKVKGSPRQDEYLKRFQREARLLAQLAHPNIVACYQAGMTDDGNCYMVMEFIEGCDLRAWVGKHGALPQDLALHVARDLAAALREAHKQGIIHRDVKPENVLLQFDGDRSNDNGMPFTVKLADLGLARPGSVELGDTQLTGQGVILGTPSTMAPEQFDDPDAIDHRVDIYGLGCVLYYALCAKPAFTGQTLTALFKAKMDTTTPDPRKADGRCCDKTAALVADCLETDASKRIADYDELLRRIDEITQPGAAKPGTTKVSAGVQLSPPLIAAAAVVVLALLGGLIYALSSNQSSSQSLNQPATDPVPTAVAQSELPGEDTASAKPVVDDPTTSDDGGEPLALESLRFGLPQPLLRNDYLTRLKDWETRGSIGPGEADDEVHAMGESFARRDLPSARGRVQCTLRPLQTGPGAAAFTEAGVALSAGENKGVAIMVQNLGATVIASIKRLPEREPIKTMPLPVRDAYAFDIKILPRRVVVEVAGVLVGELPGDQEVKQIGIINMGGGASFSALTFEELRVLPSRLKDRAERPRLRPGQ